MKYCYYLSCSVVMIDGVLVKVGAGMGWCIVVNMIQVHILHRHGHVLKVVHINIFLNYIYRDATIKLTVESRGIV